MDALRLIKQAFYTGVLISLWIVFGLVTYTVYSAFAVWSTPGVVVGVGLFGVLVGLIFMSKMFFEMIDKVY